MSRVEIRSSARESCVVGNQQKKTYYTYAQYARARTQSRSRRRRRRRSFLLYLTKKENSGAPKTFSDVPFIGKVVREAGGGERVVGTVALCTIYINNVHETAKNKSDRYIYT